MTNAHATATATNITIYPKADTKDCYLMHNDGKLVATIIEWCDCVEVRVTRLLTGEEHEAAMAFVGTLAGRDCTLINYDAAGAIAVAGGCFVEKATPAAPPTAAVLEIAAALAEAEAEPVVTRRPRLILLPINHSCVCGESEDDPCPSCQALINRATRAADDRSAATEYSFYEGMVA